jgi:hypothetical protein
MRILILLAFVTASIWLGAPAIAAEANCTSLQARCTVKAGGQCDRQTGHWCYGHYQGRECGGTGAAFRACMDRGGGASAAAVASNKCTSIKARCAMEVGGHCVPRTGYWCVGPGNRGNRYCGGTIMSFLACLDRIRAAQK